MGIGEQADPERFKINPRAVRVSHPTRYRGDGPGIVNRSLKGGFRCRYIIGMANIEAFAADEILARIAEYALDRGRDEPDGFVGTDDGGDIERVVAQRFQASLALLQCLLGELPL